MDWGYAEQMEMARLRAEQDMEIDRYRKREDIYQGIVVDSFVSRNANANQQQKQNQNNGCEDLKKELSTMRKEMEDQKRKEEIKEALEKGRKEVTESARKEKENQNHNQQAKEANGKWEMEREYGMFERSRGAGGSGIEQRMDDLEIFERGIARGRQTQPIHPPARRPAVYNQPFPYEQDDFGYGSGGNGWGGPPVRRGGDAGLDGRLKGIEDSQLRMEQRFQFEDAKRKWQKEHRQEDILLRLNDTVGRLGRRLEY
jgi:hypothetical protein